MDGWCPSIFRDLSVISCSRITWKVKVRGWRAYLDFFLRTDSGKIGPATRFLHVDSSYGSKTWNGLWFVWSIFSRPGHTSERWFWEFNCPSFTEKIKRLSVLPYPLFLCFFIGMCSAHVVFLWRKIYISAVVFFKRKPSSFFIAASPCFLSRWVYIWKHFKSRTSGLSSLSCWQRHITHHVTAFHFSPFTFFVQHSMFIFSPLSTSPLQSSAVRLLS